MPLGSKPIQGKPDRLSPPICDATKLSRLPGSGIRKSALAALFTLMSTTALAQGGRIVLPFEQALDNNGDPISGAVWCFDEAGTTTDKSVYSDKALTTALGSSVTTDANGRLTSDVYTDTEVKITLATGTCANPSVVAGPWDFMEPKNDFGSFASLTTANTFTGNATWTNTGADASAGPVLTLYRDSASPAASDIMGQIVFSGEDSGSGSAPTTYCRMSGVIVDETDPQEDGQIVIDCVVAGAVGEELSVGGGVVAGSATGGAQGVGTVNATAYYTAGSETPNTSCFTSTAQTITANTLLTLAHSLGARPWTVDVLIENTAIDQDYEVGDYLVVPVGSYEAGTTVDHGVSAQVDATNVELYINDTIEIANETSGEVAGITMTSWSLYVRACL